MLNLFFQSSAAEFLQQVAIFFEISGLSFIILDVYFPDHADCLEKNINFIVEKRSDYISMKVELYLYMTIVPIIFLGIHMFGFPLFISSWEYYGIIPSIIVYTMIAGLLVVLISTLLIFVSEIIKFLHRITNGKALAGFGLILASVGTACELYQVITLCVGQGCYGGIAS